MMEDKKNELDDILLSDYDSLDTSSKRKKILVIVASLLLLFVIILIIMKVINRPDEISSLVDDNLIPVVTQPNATTNISTPIVSANDTNGSSVIVESVTNDTMPKLSDIEDVKEPVVTTPSLETAPSTATTKEQTKPATTNTKPSTTKSVKASSKPVKNKYYIQVGSFAKNTPNRDFLTKIEQRRYNYILYDSKIGSQSVTKVLIGTYNNELEARNALPTIRKNIAQDAFLFKE